MPASNPRVRAAACVTVFMAHAAVASAQWQANGGPAGGALGAIVGSDVERYVHALTISGLAPATPWAARPFGPGELAALLADTAAKSHPWQRALLNAVRPRARAVASLYVSGNSAFPWGANDGVMWQGRGLTAAAGAALTFRWGPLSAVAAPVAFSAANTAFPLEPVAGTSPFRNGVFPTAVDHPQRMGDRAYTRVTAGESTVRLGAKGVAVGISTGSLGWGVGETFPALFGANAGGFSRVFAGTTGRGIRIPGVGRLATQYVLGTLEQTAWSPVTGSDTYVSDTEVGRRRVGSGLIVSLTPSIFPNLELGASRFYHTPMTRGSTKWSSWSKPIEGIFKTSRVDAGSSGDAGSLIDNQLASFFARWTFPGRGVEASFEMFRDDHNLDRRDFYQEPENNGAALSSLRAVVNKSATQMGVVTLEYFNGDIARIAQQRSQGALYTHQPLAQGHTERGQLLGSPLGVGAISGTRAAYERFTPTGSMRATVQRWRTRTFRSGDPEALYRPVVSKVENSHDWVLDTGVGLTRVRRHQSYSVDAGVAWAGVWNFGDSRTK